jgi:DNA-binding transcriptional regulator YiaG
MTYSDFLKLTKAAPKCGSADDFCAAYGTQTEGAHMLPTIWRMAHDGLTIRSLSAACDISVRRIALQYGIPTRTVENWASGDRTPPEWQLPLIAYAVMSDSIGD